MVAKGHHFEGVALAAVVDADTGLGLPDLRAEERTFQLVTQLAGRSGRDAPGRVLVQTFQPDARPIALAARHAVEEFLAGELRRRRELGYPPFRHLVRVVVSGGRRTAPRPCSASCAPSSKGSGTELLGPVPLLRLRGRHRAQILAKTDSARPVAARAGRLLAAAAGHAARRPAGIRRRGSPGPVLSVFRRAVRENVAHSGTQGRGKPIPEEVMGCSPEAFGSRRG